MSARDEEVKNLKLSLINKIFKTNQVGDKEKPNPEWEAANRKVKELQAIMFCKACEAQRESRAWIRCPYCQGATSDWIGSTHNLPACAEARDWNQPFCSGCGQPN
jgi:hypothetical protein